MDAYSSRRARLAAEMDGGVAVIPAARERMRNSHTEYEFRQDSDFKYLTGFDEPDAVLVVAPHHERERVVLFSRPRDRDREIWTGRRLGVQAAPARLNVDAAYALDELDSRLPRYLFGADRLYYNTGVDEAFDRRMHAALASAQQYASRSGRAPEQIVRPGSILHEMRLFKDPGEIETMRKAAHITGLGHIAAMAATKPEMYEYQLEALIEYEYFKNGAQSVAYPSIVAGGANATIMHYNTNRERLNAGELVLVDSGCEYDCYASDVTRTWPVNGRFSPEQRAVYEVVLAAQQAGMDAVKPGVPCRDFHRACVRTVTEGLLDLGLLSGSVEENVELERYRAYFMTGSGHWLGLDVHDAGGYRDRNGSERLFAPGMVTTVEPGIYIAQDAECDERFRGIGIRIEDDLLVTQDGHENLTAHIPKSIGRLEELVGEALCA